MRRPIDTSTKFTTEAWIERIIILGYPKNPGAVIIHSGDKQATPIYAYYDKENILVIRRPGPPITTDWTLSIS